MEPQRTVQHKKREPIESWNSSDEEPILSPKGKSREPPLFACPFFKNDQVKYANARVCNGPGWPKVNRLKEHLFRKHRQPIHCDRCGRTFSSDGDLEAHQRQDTLCPLVLDMSHTEGLDENQVMKVKSRKMFFKMSEVEKWKKIYQILFPDVTEDLIPSPYYEVGDASEFPSKEALEEIRRQLPSYLMEHMSGVLEGLGANHSNEALREYVTEAVNSAINASGHQPSLNPKTTTAVAEDGPLQDHSLTRSPLGEIGPGNRADSDSSIIGVLDRDSSDLLLQMDEESILYEDTTDANMLIEPKSTDPRQGRKCNVQYPDSGYHSAESNLYRSMQGKGSSKPDGTEGDETNMTRNRDENDTGTSYSAISTILTDDAEKCVVDVCDSINKRLEASIDRRSLSSVSKRLPDIIKAFALKIGSDIPDRLNLRVMHFVHKHSQYIADQLQQDFHHDEDEPTNTRELTDAMSLEEIMKLWGESQNKAPALADTSQYFEGIDDEEDEVSALSEYSERIVNSVAYEWLISSLVKEASFQWDGAQSYPVVDRIRQEIISHLSTGRVSSRRPPSPHTVSFKVHKSSLPILSENLAMKSSPTRIADRIVATSSSAHHIQLSRINQYMDQTWPLGGSTILTVLQNVIDGGVQDKAFSALEGNTRIEIDLKGNYLEACVTGTSYSISEYGEQLAWLTAALQPAVAGHATYISPSMRRVDENTCEKGSRHIWIIEFETEASHDANISARAMQEWMGESRSPVIVRGFPTMSRPGDCPGIEVPLQLRSSWSPILSQESTGTRLLLNATGKVLQLFKHNNDVTVWHILSSPREICACHERSLEHNGHDHLPCLDFAELQQYRHIITECSTAKLYDRDTIQRTEPGIGSTEISQRECSLLEAPQRITRSENDTDSSDSLDEDMLSIPDSSEYGVGGRPITDDATLAAIEEVASRLVIEYGRYTEHNSANEYPGNTKQCSPGGQQSLPTHGSSYSTLGVTATQASSTNTSRTRPAEQDDGDGDEDAQRGPPQKKLKKGDPGNTQLNFACPFWKLSPGKHRNCFGKRLGRICRVKQHLVRTHMQEFRCDRCLAVFKDEAHKLAHLQSEQCMFENKRCGVITTEKRNELSKKSRASLTEPQQWFRVWEILFPGLPRPSSPYLDAEVSEDLNHFREVSERRAPSVFMEVFHDEGLVIPGDSEREALIRRAVSRAIGSLYDRCLNDRNATSQNSTSEGSSSAVPSGLQGDERRRALVPMYEELSSNADSGVELRSQPSSGREDTDLRSCIPARPRPPSDGTIDERSFGTANPGVHAADPLDTGPKPPQLSVEPRPVDTDDPKLASQHWGDDRDPESQDLVPEEQTFNAAFDFYSYYNPHQF